ncbi:ATP-binding protein [Clostridium sp. CF012]|nr:ATP-binding protein [Clostridium sp. CF012]
MGCDNQTFIGKIKNVSGNKISVRLDERVKSMMPIIDGIVYRVGQIGSFIKIPLGYTHVFAIITQIGADAIPESLRLNHEQIEKEMDYGTRWLSAVLIGERVGTKFERGVLQIPSSDDDVHLVTKEDLSMIYGSEDGSRSITIGHISNSESLPAYVDIDKLVSRHCAVLGATGSGKSNAVSVILKEIALGDFKSARILLIDPHGEYNNIFKGYSKVFRVNAKEVGEEELNIPYWALPFNELMKIFPGELNDKKEDYFRQEILKRKISAAKYLEHIPREETITSDSPIPFSINQLWFDLDDFEKQTHERSRQPETKMTLIKKGNAENLVSNEYPPASSGSGSPFINFQAQGIQGFLDGMRNRLVDQRYSFLFNPGEWTPEASLEGRIKKDLDKLIEGWIGHDKPITILDLSGIPSEMMMSIAGTLIKIVYDCLFWGQNLKVGGRQQPLLFVLEEAHNYLKSGENSVASRTVQAIAKEGRKYGVGLLLATQRASELDETVLSQCGTVVALRMTNNGDKSKVAGAIQQDLDNMISLLPSLRTGEAIISGEAVKIPCRIKFDKIPDAPKSSDPKVSVEWKKEKPSNEGYSKVISLWRSGRLTDNEKETNKEE